MKETKLYAKLRPHLMSWGTCDRVENTLGSGMSDVFYNIGGCVGWIETKIAKSGSIYFEKFQPNWIRKHTRQGLGRMFVVVLNHDKSVLLYRGADVVDAKMYPHNDWLIVQLLDLPDPVVSVHETKPDWSAFKQALIS